MNRMYYQTIDSPVGPLWLVCDEHALTGLYLEGQKYFPTNTQDWLKDPQHPLLVQTNTQLDEYFARQRQMFDLPFAPTGTAFQKQVWRCLSQIPFGTTISYGDLAQRLGKPTAFRAVGAANGRNPLSIIVPCHRVIAANRSMTGYAGGIDRKRWLLNHEQAQTPSRDRSHQISLPLR